VLSFTLVVLMGAEVAKPVALTVAVPPALVLQLDGALPRLNIDVISLLCDDGDATGGAEDANSAVGGQLVLGAHFALSLTHREARQV
jgi:hypothetical protein